MSDPCVKNQFGSTISQQPMIINTDFFITEDLTKKKLQEIKLYNTMLCLYEILSTRSLFDYFINLHYDNTRSYITYNVRTQYMTNNWYTVKNISL